MSVHLETLTVGIKVNRELREKEREREFKKNTLMEAQRKSFDSIP